MRRRIGLSFFYGADPILFALNAVAMFFSGWAFLDRYDNVITVLTWATASLAVIIAIGGFFANRQRRKHG
jgi:hypothetical protein